MKIFNKEHTIDFSEVQDHTKKVSTGIKSLDADLLGGMEAGTTNWVMAESGKGKSVYIDCAALNNALFFAKHRPNDWVHLILYEQDSEIRSRRIACTYHRTSLKQAGENLSLPKMNLIITDMQDLEAAGFGMDMDGLRNYLAQMQEDGYNPGMVYIDYMANMDSLLGTDHNSYKVAAKKMERIALHFNVPILSGHQAVKDNEFTYEQYNLDEKNIAVCKALKNASSLFFSINRTKQEFVEKRARLYVFKNRNGPEDKEYPIYMDLSTFTIGDL